MKKVVTGILLCFFSSSALTQTTFHVLPEAESYFSKADSLKIERKYDDAYRSAIEAQYLYKKEYGKESAEYGVALGRTAEYLFWCSGNWEPDLLEGLSLVSNTKGTRCDEYAKLLTIYAKYEMDDKDSLQRMTFARQAVNIRRELLGTEHPDYAWSLATLGDCLYDGGHYDDAIPLFNEAVAVLRKHEATHTRQLGNVLDLLYKACRKSNRHEEGLAALSEILEIETRQFGRSHELTRKTMRNLANYYSEQGKELEAYRLKEELNQQTDQTKEQQDQLSSVKYLTQLAVSHENRGRYDLAYPFYKQVLYIYEKRMNSTKGSIIDSMEVARASTNLAFCYERAGLYNSAINAANKAMKIWKKMGLDNDTTYVELLNRIALCYYRRERYNEAKAYAKHGIGILDANSEMGCMNQTYVDALRIMSWSEAEEGLADDAERHARRALEILEQTGKQHTNLYTYCQYELAERMLHTDDASKGLSLYETALSRMKQTVLNNFSSQSAQERQVTWNRLQLIFHDSYPQFCITYHLTKNHIEDASALYDYSALFAKGLMLTAETGLNEQVRRTGDVVLMARLDTLQTLRTQLTNLYEHLNAQQASQALELSQQIEYREKELILMLKNTGKDYTELLQTSWRDVQKALGPEDIAVEFVTAHLENLDIEATIALTLRYDDPYPRMKLVFDSWGLSNIDLGNIYEDPTLCNIVWGALDDRLAGIKNIYFAPSGPLHNLGIENLPGCKLFNFYRLSSTRELVRRQQQKKAQNAILYGGLFYDTDLADMQSESLAYKRNVSFASASYNSRSIIDSLRVRGASEGTPYLEGTATEVAAIAQLAKSRKIKATTLTGAKGNEESFKALSGESIQVMHIATHGFYWTEEATKASEQNDLDDKMPRRNTEDKALSRSGLLMAGADNALEGDVPEDIEDGILTAQEIAQLDLNNLDMVVLSACETALGDVSKGEGIFGLQRGFKKAGANSILMSLWKVDDEATCMLMTEFYKFWLSGETKHDALELAKDVVRSHQERKWDNPDFWAAFILLDGID